MDILQIKGVVKAILEAQTGTSKAGKEWKKQSFVIETEGNYPKKAVFDVFNDECLNVLSSMVVGEKVNVCFDVDAHEWNGKWFNDIRAYKIERNVSSQAQPQAEQTPAQATTQEPIPQPEGADKLPF